MNSCQPLGSIVEQEIATIEEQLAARRELATLMARSGHDISALLADLLKQESMLLGIKRLAGSVGKRST